MLTPKLMFNFHSRAKHSGLKMQTREGERLKMKKYEDKWFSGKKGKGREHMLLDD